MLVSPYAWQIPGGVNAHIKTLAREFTKRGYFVAIAAPGTSATDHPAQFFSLGPTRAFGANGAVANLAISTQAWSSLKAAIKAFSPQLLHLHEPLAPLANYYGLFQARIPVVATFHAYYPDNPFYRFAKPLLRWVLRRLKGVTAVSAAAEQTARWVLPAKMPVLKLGNPIDINAYLPSTDQQQRRSGAGRRHTHVLFVGRSDARKGLPVLLAAYDKLNRQGQAERLRLTVAGSQHFKEAPAKVAFLGRVSAKALIQAYQDADIFCAPALGGESFGIVLVEAMAAGAAVIASDLPGFREVLDEGKAGILVPAGDVDAWAAALLTLSQAPDQIKALAQRGQQRARDFDIRRTADVLLDLYKECTNQHVD